MNDKTQLVVKLQMGEAKFIQAILKFKADATRFGHAIFFNRTIFVSDGHSLVIMPRGDFLKGIADGKMMFGSTPSGASATTLWGVGTPSKEAKEGFENTVKSSLKGKFAVIDIDAKKLLVILQAIMATSPTEYKFNAIRIGIRTDETGEFWGKPSTSPIVIALADITRPFSPLLSVLMPIHIGSGSDDNRSHAINALLQHFSDDMSEKPTDEETKDESQEH